PRLTRADLMAIGDQVGCSALTSAAIPAMCGAAIEVPLMKSYVRSWLDAGATAARTSTPGAEMSGLTTSPSPRVDGPREEKDTTSGTWVVLPTLTPARISTV